MRFDTAILSSPVGTLTIAAQGDELVALCFDGLWQRHRSRLLRHHPGASFAEADDPAGACSALRRWFDGELGALDGLAVAPVGTPFQRSVWSELRRIPRGRTRSYGEVAAAVGRPGATRAVGTANGANPIGIVIPCHRVLAAGGALGGFAGGLDAKRWLLRHEGALRPGCE